MTMRQRMLALIRGEEVDRVPFVTYRGVAAPDEEVWGVVGRENMGILVWTAPYRVEHPNCHTVEEPLQRDGLEGRRTIIETPRGSMTSDRYFEPTYHTASISRHFVTEPDDYDVLLAYLEDGVVVPDPHILPKLREELGEDGLPLVRVDRTPYQQLWVQWVSLDDLVLHLVDIPERVAPCVEAMATQQRRIFEVVATSGADFADFPDNITAPVIGERYFRQYCVPYYDELAEILGDEIPVYVHMDGDLKPLWDAIGQSGVRGLDSMSPPPDNDTSPGEAVSMWPKMRVCINFPSSVHLATPEVVYATTMDFLEQAGHTGRFQIQISENVPPFAWRLSYPEIVRAIRDFSD
ncbi:uroporphyrinogen decarboxylase family protein [Candidatus Latescibacterota bacterium]